MQPFSAAEADRKKQTPSGNRHSLRESGIESNRHVFPNLVAKGTAPSVRRKHSFKITLVEGRGDCSLQKWHLSLHLKVGVTQVKRWGGNSRCKGPEVERPGERAVWWQAAEAEPSGDTVQRESMRKVISIAAAHQ